MLVNSECAFFKQKGKLVAEAWANVEARCFARSQITMRQHGNLERQPEFVQTDGRSRE
ncbi:hypothetical protein Q644_11585 [Brucella intermedia 229E]|uniref:Uncharacterized protein n=1 Tax=Brucella intermedia 229E TaxID=1337887 RepID=U4VBL4_9HYPH|nr:hypothetical protein Q644_11585 [Brucella intermedia 229E]